MTTDLEEFAYLHPCRPKGAHPHPDHWTQVRLKRLSFAGNRCETCDLGETDGVRLQCHHRHYRTFGQEEMGDVCILCHNCHEAVTAVWMQRRERILRRYRSHQVHVKSVESERIMTPTSDAKSTHVAKQDCDRVMTSGKALKRPDGVQKLDVERVM